MLAVIIFIMSFFLLLTNFIFPFLVSCITYFPQLAFMCNFLLICNLNQASSPSSLPFSIPLHLSIYFCFKFISLISLNNYSHSCYICFSSDGAPPRDSLFSSSSLNSTFLSFSSFPSLDDEQTIASNHLRRQNADIYLIIYHS